MRHEDFNEQHETVNPITGQTDDAQDQPFDFADVEEALTRGGFRPFPRKHRRCSFGDVFSYRRADDGWVAHIIVPPRAWGAPHTRRIVLVLNHHFDTDAHGADVLVADEHGWIGVIEAGAHDEVAMIPLTARGIALLRPQV